jgi:sugar lactone lactonase YvrE
VSQTSLSPPPVRFPSIRRLVQVVATDAHEGPVYVAAEDSLYITSVPRRGGDHPVVAVRRLALDGRRFPLEPERVETVREDANVANGMARDRDGRLVVCEQGTFDVPAAITRDGRGSSKDFEDQAANGRPSALHLARAGRCRAASRSSWTATSSAPSA